jgi:hypothetical protein
LSSEEQKELVNSHIKGSSLIRKERGIETIIFEYSKCKVTCLLVEDVVMIPLKLEYPLYHYEQNTDSLLNNSTTDTTDIVFEIEISSSKKKLKNIFQISVLVFLDKTKTLFEFTSMNLQTSYQLLQSCLDFLVKFLQIKEKSQINIHTTNKSYFEIAFGKLLIGQIWKCYHLKQISILEIKNLSIISNGTERMRKLVSYHKIQQEKE